MTFYDSQRITQLWSKVLVIVIIIMQFLLVHTTKLVILPTNIGLLKKSQNLCQDLNYEQKTNEKD